MTTPDSAEAVNVPCPDHTLRVRIAEGMGWKQLHARKHRNGVVVLYGKSPGQTDVVLWYRIPDYPNDLNACAQFEAGLTAEQVHVYSRELCASTQATGKDGPEDWLNLYALYHATARQRCEAYLATLLSSQ